MHVEGVRELRTELAGHNGLSAIEQALEGLREDAHVALTGLRAPAELISHLRNLRLEKRSGGLCQREI